MSKPWLAQCFIRFRVFNNWKNWEKHKRGSKSWNKQEKPSSVLFKRKLIILCFIWETTILLLLKYRRNSKR
ncbi:unnamed protein product [Blepharisma stoltei]|uniref:Ribosomal protein L32 n=1 Tax=Blepharisma stoltei TaxID=1481888 RepID=A0AAU9ILK6_9CILI|nr:unnamed protein product [Blepharisma stoltei]